MQGGQRRADPEPRPGDSRRLTGPGEAPRQGDSGRGETGGRARRRAARPLGDATRCERAHKGAQAGGYPPPASGRSRSAQRRPERGEVDRRRGARSSARPLGVALGGGDYDPPPRGVTCDARCGAIWGDVGRCGAIALVYMVYIRVFCGISLYIVPLCGYSDSPGGLDGSAGLCYTGDKPLARLVYTEVASRLPAYPV